MQLNTINIVCEIKIEFRSSASTEISLLLFFIRINLRHSNLPISNTITVGSNSNGAAFCFGRIVESYPLRSTGGSATASINFAALI